MYLLLLRGTEPLLAGPAAWLRAGTESSCACRGPSGSRACGRPCAPLLGPALPGNHSRSISIQFEELTDLLQAMEALGEPTLKPFLQDVIQLGPLVRTMVQQVGGLGGP